MLTEKDYCDYDTCVALREIGCRIKTEWYIHQPSYERGACYLCFGIPQVTSVLDECDYIPRLTLYEAQKWLREEKGIELTINPEWDYFTHRKGIYYTVEITYWKGDKIGYITDTLIDVEDIEDETAARYKTYEEALSEGIKGAVKILKENYE